MKQSCNKKKRNIYILKGEKLEEKKIEKHFNKKGKYSKIILKEKKFTKIKKPNKE
jgi:hypothetical protein